jgi:integrase
VSDGAPRYRRTKYPSVYVRHEKGCPAALVDGLRCRCEPSYRARHRRFGHSPTFKDIHEANGWLLDAKRGKFAQSVKPGPEAELTFAALAEQWREAVRVGKVGTRRKRRAYSRNTLRQYDVALREHIYPEIGDRAAASLTVVDWQDLIDTLRAKGLKTNSIHNYLNPVRAIYAWACSPARRLLLANATAGLELPPSDETARTRVASPTEFRGLLAVLGEDDQVVWGLAGYAGLRAHEIDGADWSGVDFDQGGVFVPDSKSEAGVRWVPMVAPLRMILLAAWMRQGQPKAGRVVVGSVKAAKQRALGEPSKGRVGAWERAGLVPIGLHECRHTYNTWLHAAGVPLMVQARVVGHEDETLSLRRYTHIMDGQVRAAGATLDTWLGGQGMS